MVLVRHAIRLSRDHRHRPDQAGRPDGYRKTQDLRGLPDGPGRGDHEAVPANLQVLANCEPVYEEIDGWTGKYQPGPEHRGITEERPEIPRTDRELAGTRLVLVSVGAGRDETSFSEKSFRCTEISSRLHLTIRRLAGRRSGFHLELQGTLAQLVEQRTFNPLVAGSIPARPTTFKGLAIISLTPSSFR